MKLKLLAIAAFVLSACDSGGPIDERVAKIKRDPYVGVLPAECYSACTMEMASPYACISPTRWLGFHGPQNTRSEVEYWYYVDLIASHYPPRLAEWYRTEGHKTLSIKTGQWVVDMGGRSC